MDSNESHQGSRAGLWSEAYNFVMGPLPWRLPRDCERIPGFLWIPTKSFCSKSSCTYVHSLQRAKDTDAASTVACIRKSNQGHEFLTIPVRSMAVFGGAGGKVGMLLAGLGSCGGLLGSFLQYLSAHQVHSSSSGHLHAM